MRWVRVVFAVCLLPFPAGVVSGADGNRLAYLDEFADPYWPGLQAARLVTPQWIGEPGVESVVVLSTDDLRDTAKYESYLRPILDRLKKIDGRAPVSIITNSIDPNDPQVKSWLAEGLSIETHTTSHPCPCLQGGDFARAKATYDACVDLLMRIPGGRPVGFRMPCGDSMNSLSPRFFAEIFNKTTPGGNFLAVDSSVFNLPTPGDPALPREMVFDPDGREKFRKYAPADRNFVNMIEDYPYPYVIARLCWEFPMVMPSDWQAQHLHKPNNPITVRDLKTNIDIGMRKQGLSVVIFHPHGWIRNDQVVELIDHVVEKHGKRVKFLNLRDVERRLTKNMLGGHPLRASNGQDNGVRVLDVNNDGYMDVVIGNEKLRQTRIWSPKTRKWATTDFPAEIVSVDEKGNRRDAGVRFGVLRQGAMPTLAWACEAAKEHAHASVGMAPGGFVSVLIRNEKRAGLWHFNGQRWVADPDGLKGLDNLYTSKNGRDRSVRFRDLDQDGQCELIVGNDEQRAVYAWSTKPRGWKRLPFVLPEGAAVVGAKGRDAGLRFVDVDEDGRLDVLFSNHEHYSLHLFTSMKEGWRCVLSGKRGEKDAEEEIPPIVRTDGTNNGAWFKYRHMWVQNEETGRRLPHHVDSRSFIDHLLRDELEPPARPPQGSLDGMRPRSGFQVELMAHEPTVMDPIDIAWGPDGRAWVVEMADYPLGMDGRGKPGGRVRTLEDTDGDGRYDRSALFLDGLNFPSGVMPWRNGVLVTAAPDVFYAEDTNGDGRADVRRTLFTGFHEGNQQHRVNHPRWGLDNWVHVGNGDSNGLIRSLKTGKAVDISGRDLRIRPDDGGLEAQTGRTQYGLNRDDWGNWFGCNNNTPGWHYVLDDHYLRRNPHVAPPSGRRNLAGSRDVYPGGRIMTHCYIPQKTPPEGRPGAWTSLAGIMVYRDALFGPDYAGNVFMGDSVYCVIHRNILEPDGVTFRGHRGPGEEKSEFLGSADPWFRPATIRTGPDGALWVADMYRYVIEHPEWIDDRLEKTLPLRRGHDLGRIYRIYPVGKKPRPIPRLDKLDTAGLVAALDHPGGWQRDMAHQMLVWRADSAAVGPLEEMVKAGKQPVARLHALCVLDGLDALRPEIIRRALADEHPGVRRRAIRVSEPLLDENPALGEALLKLIGDPDPLVQVQLAYSLGEWHDPRAARALAQMAVRRAGNPYMTAAVMSSAMPHVAGMIAEVQAQPESAPKKKLLAALTKLAADIKAHPDAVAELDAVQSGPLRLQSEALVSVETSPRVKAAMERFQPVLDMTGDPVRGKEVYVEATCSICHRIEDIGDERGPDIKTLVDRSAENLLVGTIDPNRAVKERYLEYTVETADGVQLSGMLMDETSASITLAKSDGKLVTVLRRDLEEMVENGRSFMQEGLEEKLSLGDMADLIAYMRKATGAADQPPQRNRPRPVRAGDGGVLRIPADAAELFGPKIIYETKYGNIGWWDQQNAYAAWTIEPKQPGIYTIWLDWAHPTGGNRFVMRTGTRSSGGKVPSTGSWDNYRWAKFGTILLHEGRQRLEFRPDAGLSGPLIDLRNIVLVPKDVKWQPPK